MTIDDAIKRLAVSRRTVYNWIDAGRLRVIEHGSQGRGSVTLLDRGDVERESALRRKDLEQKLREAEGGL